MDAFIAGHLRGVSCTYALVVPMPPRGLKHTVVLAHLPMRVVRPYHAIVRRNAVCDIASLCRRASA